MTTAAVFAVFEDFNDRQEEPAAPPVEDTGPTFEEIADQIRSEAWTEGYLTGRKEVPNDNPDQGMTVKLLARLDQLDGKTAEAIDAASLAVADLLVNTVIAVAADEWSAKLLDRVRMVAARIKPALTVEPEFILRDDGGTERRFADIASLSRAMDEGVAGEDVTIRWHRGEATISRKALLEDLREAVLPLSAGLVNEQNAGHVS